MRKVSEIFVVKGCEKVVLSRNLTKKGTIWLQGI